MAEKDAKVSTSIGWLLGGWAAVVCLLIVSVPLGIFLFFGLLFCDAPGAPCGGFLLFGLLAFFAFSAGLFFVIRGLLRRHFAWHLRALAFGMAASVMGCFIWVYLEILEQAV
ncbi:hypothetical protein H0274_03405 [Altererythrobacter sp. CC-YST694]|uniref:hypothetical protein n=1 Tax=Altererythrobacter sp. CC-YST694 TaxID=2755038 RepID=UPI001D03250A|nr:hypothetical protein [Altererythrobacter sp. CC-YST694]MCB5424296.1 hypothetical protein [Altererythrobacter sp. CC-YST694]